MATQRFFKSDSGLPRPAAFIDKTTQFLLSNKLLALIDQEQEIHLRSSEGSPLRARNDD